MKKHLHTVCLAPDIGCVGSLSQMEWQWVERIVPIPPASNRVPEILFQFYRFSQTSRAVGNPSEETMILDRRLWLAQLTKKAKPYVAFWLCCFLFIR